MDKSPEAGKYRLLFKLILPPKISVYVEQNNLYENPELIHNFKCIHNFFITDLEEFQRLSLIQNFAISVDFDFNKFSDTEINLIKQYLHRAKTNNLIQKFVTKEIEFQQP